MHKGSVTESKKMQILKVMKKKKGTLYLRAKFPKKIIIESHRETETSKIKSLQLLLFPKIEIH